MFDGDTPHIPGSLTSPPMSTLKPESMAETMVRYQSASGTFTYEASCHQLSGTSYSARVQNGADRVDMMST